VAILVSSGVRSEYKLAAHLPQQDGDSVLRYFVIGDWGSIYNTTPVYAASQKAVASQMALFAQQFQPSFVISVGDNFYDYGVNSTEDPYWQHDFVDVYTDPALQIPWYMTLGNHDYMGSVDVQLQYNKDPRWKFPDRNYTLVVDMGNGETATFFFLDTSPFIQQYYVTPETPEQLKQLASQHYKEQLTWLQQGLEEASKKDNNWIIAVGHHNHDQNEIPQYLEPLFQQYGVSAYLCGHKHTLEYSRHNNIDFILSGAGSRVEEQEHKRHAIWQGKDPGFVMVEMYPSVMFSHYIDYKGNMIYDVITDRTTSPVGKRKAKKVSID
jgi:acid phosphatase